MEGWDSEWPTSGFRVPSRVRQLRKNTKIFNGLNFRVPGSGWASVSEQGSEEGPTSGFRVPGGLPCTSEEVGKKKCSDSGFRVPEATELSGQETAEIEVP